MWVGLKILDWIKQAPQWLWGVVLSVFIAWGVFKQGEKSADLRNEEEQRAREAATRTRGREANEKINSSSNTITDWLHDTNRFRD